MNPPDARKCVIATLALLAFLLLRQIASGAEVDAHAEIAAALYAASATQAAAEKQSDEKLKAQRQIIAQLEQKLHASTAETAKLRSDLAAAQEKFVADLASHDRTYEEEISIFRSAVQDIAATPEGAAALAKYNAGDEVGALAILDDLTKARAAAREKRVQIEEAADKRKIATLALDAKSKGKVTVADVIKRFEEVTKLDPGMHWDWVELWQLYTSAGNLADAYQAAKHSAETAKTQRDALVAYGELGDLLITQWKLPEALAVYRKSLEFAESLATAYPGNTDVQRDLAQSFARVGKAQLA